MLKINKWLQLPIQLLLLSSIPCRTVLNEPGRLEVNVGADRTRRCSCCSNSNTGTFRDRSASVKLFIVRRKI